MALRMTRIAVATISSMSVKPRWAYALREWIALVIAEIRLRRHGRRGTTRLNAPQRLAPISSATESLYGDDGLRSAHGNALHGRVKRAALGDGQLRLSRSLRH